MRKINLRFLKKLYFLIRQRQIRVREFLFVKKPDDYLNIPIIINNYNRFDFLCQLLNRLENDGYKNIYIIDNNSTYQPLLEFYNNTKYEIFRLRANYGYLAFWKSGIYKQFRNQYFVYTDSDIVPDSNCPSNYLEYFFKLMQKYPFASKIGFSLRIDDLPNSNKRKDKIITWETQFWLNEIESNIFKAPIDTTFALYRPNIKGRAFFDDFMIRTGSPYVARHLPWYNDDDNLSEEEKYYIEQTSTSTHWTNLNKK